MANVIKHKRGSGSDPVASDLVVGEVAIRTDVGKLFTKMDNGSVAEIAGGGSDIAINTLSSSSGTGGGSATFNGSAFRFTLSAPPSVSAQQLLVSINGVIQKPVAGTGQPSEGFSVDGTDIILGAAPATGSDFFILTFKSLGVSEPADNTVTSAKIVDGAIVNADINASAAIAGSKISPDFGSQNIITTGNINIGAGTGRLDSNGIIKTAHGTESAPSHTFINDTDNGMFRVTTNTIGFTTAGSERLRIDSSGKVGLGTGTPDSKLTLFDASTLYLHLQNNTTGGGSGDGSRIGFTGASSILRIENQENSDIAISTNGSERMRIKSDGKVGIGTSPATILHLKSNSADCDLQVESTGSATDARLNLYGRSDGVSQIRFGDQNDTNVGLLSYVHVDDSMQFRTADAERMRITSSGRVGIGESTPASLLHLSGTQTIQAGSFSSNVTTGNKTFTANIDIRATSMRGGIVVRNMNNFRSESVFNASFMHYDPFDTTATSFAFRAARGATLADTFSVRSDGRTFIGERLGIGESSPTKTVVISENDSECVAIVKSSDTGQAGLFLGGQSDEIKGGIIFDNSDNSLQLRGHNNSVAQTIDTSGRVLIGFDSDLSGGDATALLQVTQNGGGTLRLVRDDTSVTSGNNLGQIHFSGRDGGANVACGAIIGKAIGTHTTTSRPTAIIFNTTASSSATPTERFRIQEEGGISFNGDTTQANALDDYEEGTWTPVLVNGGSPSYSQQSGLYTKIGNLVRHTFIISFSGASLGTQTRIAGLPFAYSSTFETSSNMGRIGSAWDESASGGSRTCQAIGHTGLGNNMIYADILLSGSSITVVRGSFEMRVP